MVTSNLKKKVGHINLVEWLFRGENAKIIINFTTQNLQIDEKKYYGGHKKI